ncbi:DUF3343 domain-containing protein [Thermodesulfobacteriota bacterium]
MSTAEIILVFESIHDVLEAETRLAGSEIPFDLIPTPTQISTDCGMVLLCREEDLVKVRNLLCQPGPEPTGLYRRTGSDVEEHE